MICEIVISVKRCTCDACGYSWTSIKDKPPQNCQNPQCRTREWNGKRRKSHIHEIKLPAPRKGGRPKKEFNGDD